MTPVVYQPKLCLLSIMSKGATSSHMLKSQPAVIESYESSDLFNQLFLKALWSQIPDISSTVIKRYVYLVNMKLYIQGVVDSLTVQ